MLKTALNVLKFLVSIAVGLGLFWFVYKDTDFDTMYGHLSQAKYSWVALSMFISLAGFYLRAFRWKLLFEPLGYDMKVFNVLIAVFIGFFANLLFPRLGEITRCGYLKKVHGASVSESLGTVISERIIDLICFGILAVFTVVLEWDIFESVLEEILIGAASQGIKNKVLMLLIVLGVLLAGLFFLFKLGLMKKILTFLTGLLNGLLSVLKLKRARAFVLSTLGIWVIYYLMLYVLFFSLTGTSHLSPVVALSILVAGTLGMIAPVQSGIGAYHFFVSLVLTYYGITGDENQVLPLISHGSQTILVFVVGLLSLVVSSYTIAYMKTEKG